MRRYIITFHLASVDSTVPVFDDHVSSMLEVQKEALANRVRQRLVALREKELDYYTANCRMLGNQAALVSGFAYSAIRYHQWMEQQQSWFLSETETVLEVIFLALLTATMSIGLQVYHLDDDAVHP